MHPLIRQIAQSFAEDPAELSGPRVGKLPTAGEKSPRRVLVVDDEPLIRWSISESLSDLGMDVQQAGDAISALRAITIARLPFDVIVLDLRLPDMSDLSLLRTVRQLLPRARLILMTAFDTSEVAAEAARLDACVLSKPFALHDMNGAVLGRRQGRA
jgi:DNA-binding NtrC family response regulator